MDVDGVADHLIRRSRIHQIDIDVDELGAVVGEHGGAEQAVRLGVASTT